MFVQHHRLSLEWSKWTAQVDDHVAVCYLGAVHLITRVEQVREVSIKQFERVQYYSSGDVIRKQYHLSSLVKQVFA